MLNSIRTPEVPDPVCGKTNASEIAHWLDAPLWGEFGKDIDPDWENAFGT